MLARQLDNPITQEQLDQPTLSARAPAAWAPAAWVLEAILDGNTTKAKERLLIQQPDYLQDISLAGQILARLCKEIDR